MSIHIFVVDMAVESQRETNLLSVRVDAAVLTCPVFKSVFSSHKQHASPSVALFISYSLLSNFSLLYLLFLCAFALILSSSHKHNDNFTQVTIFMANKAHKCSTIWLTVLDVVKSNKYVGLQPSLFIEQQNDLVSVSRPAFLPVYSVPINTFCIFLMSK